MNETDETPLLQALPAASQPEIDHSITYLKPDRLTLALSYYHANLRQYQEDSRPSKKPNVSQLTRQYSITESMLQRYINNIDPKTFSESRQELQVMTVTEEAVLVERLLFLDDFNVPGDRDTLFNLAHALLHQRVPDRQLGRD